MVTRVVVDLFESLNIESEVDISMYIQSIILHALLINECKYFNEHISILEKYVNNLSKLSKNVDVTIEHCVDIDLTIEKVKKHFNTTVYIECTKNLLNNLFNFNLFEVRMCLLDYCTEYNKNYDILKYT